MSVRDLVGMAAFAATTLVGSSAFAVTFTMFDSTNADQLHPEVSITEITGGFEISIGLLNPEYGDVGAFFADFGDGYTSPDFAKLSFVSVAPSSNDSGDFSYEFSEAGFNAETYGGSGTLCESNVLSGSLSMPLFEGAACLRSTGSDQPNDGVNPVILHLLDPDNILSLEDFFGVAVRYKSASNFEESDKLFSSYISAVPVPPALPLLSAGVVALGLFGRRKKAS